MVRRVGGRVVVPVGVASSRSCLLFFLSISSCLFFSCRFCSALFLRVLESGGQLGPALFVAFLCWCAFVFGWCLFRPLVLVSQFGQLFTGIASTWGLLVTSSSSSALFYLGLVIGCLMQLGGGRCAPSPHFCRCTVPVGSLLRDVSPALLAELACWGGLHAVSWCCPTVGRCRSFSSLGWSVAFCWPACVLLAYILCTV